MSDVEITDELRKKADSCVRCPVCSRARDKQKGLAYWFVSKVEEGVCPSCKAYEQVYGRKAHEPVPRP